MMQTKNNMHMRTAGFFLFVLPVLLFSQREKAFAADTAAAAESANSVFGDAAAVFHSAENPEQACTELEKKLLTAAGAEKQQIHALLAAVFEHQGKYSEAETHYRQAAGLSAKGAPADTEKNRNSDSADFLLKAVRCILSRGDFAAADELLTQIASDSSAVSRAPLIKLYAVWSWLCKIENEKNLFEPIVVLKSYLDLPEMQPVVPSILFTLWYLTSDAVYAETLKKSYPASPEAAVVSGKAGLTPAPFWYFIPHKAVLPS
ncbi:MAG: hypothetical protein NC041_00360 [Bacteroides sp.]|nr:hypothetical protein [Prevotella sp.]MCM1408605.1 hypothetical protein [Treponema brennaborense]MCM1468907.1 hypothetical protein [Bacteroides sp.]